MENIGITHYALGFIVGFVFGSIPTGLWITKALYGIDIREYGSKNIGTTNVYRTVGAKTAVMVLLADMLKGIIVVAILKWYMNSDLLIVAAAIGAILGHNYSLFLGFKGGKGAATGMGLLIYLLPKTSLCCFVIAATCIAATRYVSLGSIVASFFAPILTWYFGYPAPYIYLALFGGGFIILRHKANIERLLNGTENKIKEGHAEDLKNKK
ncbi:MAG: glycerol-3-phosphate 1-O-acyltransferase PlsY [Phascolarctobacterium sp.]|nr:glycerol-3-phosphate 1-O-acyltransferase PlsY [Phascolarctobacterium sp.]